MAEVEPADIIANGNQGTPDASTLAQQIAQDELNRQQPDHTEPQTETEMPSDATMAEDTPEPESKDDSEFEKRIARLAYKEREARNQARQLQAELDRVKTQPQAPAPDADTQRMIDQRAGQIAAQRMIDQRANQIYQDGVKQFPDFDKQIQEFRNANLPIPNEMIEALDAAGNPAKVLHYLGRNIDEAERVLSLPPHRMGVELAKIADKVNAPAKIQSKAPAPIKPVTGSVKAEVRDEDADIGEWIRREDARTRGQSRFKRG